MKKHEKQKRLKEINDKLIPRLQAKLQEYDAALEEAKAVYDSTVIEASDLRDEATEIALSLTPKTKKIPTVSDHALVRYLERHHKFDLDQFRKEILSSNAISAINAGAVTIKRNGIKFKVQNNVITTVL